jgi:LacI family transcriptional regulator
VMVAAYLRPGLSTMALPHYEMGQWAVQYLINHSETDDSLEPAQHTIVCPFVARGSI